MSGKDDRGAWGSRLGFILAAAGSAVGLGNLWKFPYLTYRFGGGQGEQNGAGGFVLLYLMAIILVGIPVMIAEILIGRRGRQNPVGSFEAIRPKTAWKMTGYLGILTGFIILSYYAVVAGWTVEYVAKSVTYEFADYQAQVPDDDVKVAVYNESVEAGRAIAGGDNTSIEQNWSKYKASFDSPEALKAAVETKRAELFPVRLFHDFLASPLKQVGYFFAFMLVTVFVVLGGVSGGIERANRVLMPLLLLILLGLAGRVLTLPGGSKAISFLFKPDFSHMTFEMVLWALGQAFFSLSLGMGALLTYGSYLSKGDSIGSASLAIAGLDTLVALMASVIIFGAIFSFNLVMKDAGVGNLFTAIPVIFLSLPGGQFMVIVFYTLIMLAALTSTVSLLEVTSSYLIDERGFSRRWAVLVAGSITFAVGVPCALSFNVLSDFTIFGKTVFDLFDFFATNIALPFGGILILVFVGFVMTDAERREELSDMHPVVYVIWRFLVKYVAPVAVAFVLGALLLGKVTA